MSGSEIGNKQDAQKPRWSLLPEGVVNQVIGVLEFGAQKYSENNWQRVPGSRQRYYDATMRHIEAWWGGEKYDIESGCHHLAHAVCCLLFLLWFDGTAEVSEKEREIAEKTVNGMRNNTSSWMRW